MLNRVAYPEVLVTNRPVVKVKGLKIVDRVLGHSADIDFGYFLAWHIHAYLLQAGSNTP